MPPEHVRCPLGPRLGPAFQFCVPNLEFSQLGGQLLRVRAGTDLETTLGLACELLHGAVCQGDQRRQQPDPHHGKIDLKVTVPPARLIRLCTHMGGRESRM